MTRKQQRSEAAIRSKARRRGYSVVKSRRAVDSYDNRGEYMLADERNHVVLGDRFDATLREIDEYLDAAS